MSGGRLSEATARLLAFAATLLLLLLWEKRSQWRHPQTPRRARWPANFGLGAVDVVLVRLVFPAGAVGAALFASRHRIGLFNIVACPAVAAAAASLLLLDLTIYLQHRLFHVAPWLWRVHRVHHADPEVDLSTALRFHPLESVLSMLLKAAVVVSFGMPALSVLAFEVILNAAAMFNHTNASLPGRWEPRTRWLLVTPDMHRVHHSTRAEEANTNFGFSVSWWDRLFGTYRRPAEPSRALVPIGLPDASPHASHTRLVPLMIMPFKPASAQRAELESPNS